MLFYPDLDAFVEGEMKKLGELADANIPERGVILKVLGPNDEQGKGVEVPEFCVNHEVSGLLVDYQGLLGDSHRSAHRPSTGREKSTYPKGTRIRGHRHIFAVSPYDCNVLSDALGVEVTPELLGANLVIGRADGKDYSLSALPANTHFLIAPEGVDEAPKPPIATLVHYTQQMGCGITGNAIASRYGDTSLTKRFREVSEDNRGVLCSVEYPVDTFARLEKGQQVFFRFSRNIAP